MFLTALIVVLTICFLVLNRPVNPKENKVCFKDYCFLAELAQTAQERSRGLMFRKDLAENQAMLFIFETEDIYPFWMKNTLIPLDIIWLAQDQKVVFISKNSQPCFQEICPSITPDGKAFYVLELKAGKAEEMGLGIGDWLEIKNYE